MLIINSIYHYSVKMKKYYYALAVLLFTATYTHAQSLEEILEAHHEVVGLEATMEAETIVMKGTLAQMGMEFPLTMYQKRTDEGMKQRMQLEFQGQVMVLRAWNGEDGWKKMPGMAGGIELQDLTSEELEEVQDERMEGEFHNWEERGYTITLLDEDEFEGTPAFAIELVKENGSKSVTYLDQETFVMIGSQNTMNMQGQEITTTSVVGNYEMVEGMAFPMSIDIVANGQAIFSMNFSEILIDQEIDDSLFDRPAN
ncbi:MAG TPA: hypothetical protein DCE41_30030 [Cytophagales bacterium]|nr:hypothetical protein [Cytophagales bacterium]HAA17267.1 hypothetical protein [Cytophagales bacterium]HAP64903.1 hypothetical protein [Cytophagales bacterium]